MVKSIKVRKLKNSGKLNKELKSKEEQPLNKIVWVHRDKLRPNDYNPNHVFPEELELLATSIIEDGWTQPIVARGNGEIVDGFHRWMVAGAFEEVMEMTQNMVPVVYLRDNIDIAQQKMATIRHNRARGSHNVLKMADIVKTLIDNEGMTPDEVMARLKMDKEEVARMYSSGSMTRKVKKDFSKGWVPGIRD